MSLVDKVTGETFPETIPLCFVNDHEHLPMYNDLLSTLNWSILNLCVVTVVENSSGRCNHLRLMMCRGFMRRHDFIALIQNKHLPRTLIVWGTSIDTRHALTFYVSCEWMNKCKGGAIQA